MQNTRLNTLVNSVVGWLLRWLANPWRRISLIVINFLLGFFLGTAVSTTVGQEADWDMNAAAILVILTETTSWLIYGKIRRGPRSTEDTIRRSWFADAVNALKVGLTYSLFVEALKLGS